MKCQKIQERLAAYSADALTRREEMLVEQHLTHCPECNAEWEVLRRVIALVDATPRVKPTPGLWAGIDARLDDRPEPARPWWQSVFGSLPSSTRPLRRSLIAGAMVTAAVALALLTSIKHETPTPTSIALSPFLEQHLIMTQSEPFADRAGLGAIVAVTFREEH